VKHLICEGCRKKYRTESPTVSSPREVYARVKRLATAKSERLIVLYLDEQNHVIDRKVVSVGGLNTTRTHPREIMRPAIACGALGFILAHNHPSGSLEASQDDVDFTRAIRRAAEIVGIGLYDHVIVSSAGFVSMKEGGTL